MKIMERIGLALAVMNGYDATQSSQFRSFRSTTLQDARLDLTKATRERLQSYSRDWDCNSPLYSKLADTWEQYTVGTGIQFSSASSDPEWNKAADDVWNRTKNSLDLQSRFGFDNLQGIISRALFIDGEIFVLLTGEGPYARIQLVESHRCKTPDSLIDNEGASVVDGIKVDKLGRPVGYYFLNGDKFQLQDAVNVIHIFEPGRAGEYRGRPYCTAGLNVLHDLHDLRVLEMRANKDSSELSTIIKTASGEMPRSVATIAQKFGSASTALGSDSTVTESRRQAYMQATGGRVMLLQTGDEATQHVPARPGQETRAYWRLLAEDVCAVAGIPLAMVYPDSMQGTVYRGALDSAAAFFRCKTAVLASYFRRIRNYVIETEARFNPAIAKLPADWRNVSNGTVRSPNVDIGRNSQAMLAELQIGRSHV